MGKQWEQWQTLFFGGSKITADGDYSHESKRHLLLGRKVMTNLDSVLKSRDITLPTNVHLVKAMVFLVFTHGCEYCSIKKAECQRIDAMPKNWCNAKELMLLNCGVGEDSNQSIRREISSDFSLEGLMLKLKLQYFGHLMWRTDSLERPWCWEWLKAGGEGDDRGWDGWMASLTQWTWVWANSGSWWWTGRHGCCCPWCCKESDTTEWLNWTELMRCGWLFPSCRWENQGWR